MLRLQELTESIFFKAPVLAMLFVGGMIPVVFSVILWEKLLWIWLYEFVVSSKKFQELWKEPETRICKCGKFQLKQLCAK
jgi:hypothetical protein